MSESSEDELDMYPPKCFDVGAIPKNYDANAVPTCGLDYLRQVRLELSKCPQVVRVEFDETKMKSNQQPVFKGPTNYLTPAPPGFGPTPKFLHEQETEFCNLRGELLSKKPMLQKKFPKKADVPKIKDMEAWRLFCLGNKDPSAKSLSPTEAGKISAAMKGAKSTEGSPPLLSSIIWLIQPDVEILLSYHLEWLRQYGFSDQQGRWIYSLMVLLEKPLTPNACDVLRKLAHTCSELRSKLKSKHDPSLTALNLIIGLVACYFDQKDMQDDVKEFEKFKDYEDEDEEEDDGDEDEDASDESEEDGE